MTASENSADPSRKNSAPNSHGAKDSVNDAVNSDT